VPARLLVLTVGARPRYYKRRMSCNEQAIQRTRAPAATTSIEFQLAFGTWGCLNQREFRRDAIRILSAKPALSR
jgi:hypothetical protein